MIYYGKKLKDLKKIKKILGHNLTNQTHFYYKKKLLFFFQKNISKIYTII